MQLSYEFYPPRSEEGVVALKASVRDLLSLPTKPCSLSITCGAGGSEPTGTYETADILHGMAGDVPVLAHITAWGVQPDQARKRLRKHLRAGRPGFVVIRGDLPGEESERSSDSMDHAIELVRLIRAETRGHQVPLQLEVGCYPEVHPKAESAQSDFDHFRAKVEAGADVALTQLFYNTDSFLWFLDLMDRAGMNVPLVPGIMPILSLQHCLRMAKNCGAQVPDWIQRSLADYEEGSDDQTKCATDIMAVIIQRLLDTGRVKRLHFYTVNQAASVQALLQRLHL